MENKKLNGFNNGIDITDGIGGRPPYSCESIDVETSKNSLNISDFSESTFIVQGMFDNYVVKANNMDEAIKKLLDNNIGQWSYIGKVTKEF